MGIKVDIKRKLGEFSLDIHFQTESKRIGILGASGCGKSMTLKSIAGIETPDFGMIQIDDKVLLDSANKVDLKPQKRNVGYLFQNYALFPTMTVAKNIAAGLKGSKEEKQKKVQEMIEKFELTGLADRFWRDWKKDFRESFPAGGSRELRWRGSWRMSRMSFCWMSHFPHWTYF